MLRRLVQPEEKEARAFVIDPASSLNHDIYPHSHPLPLPGYDLLVFNDLMVLRQKTRKRIAAFSNPIIQHRDRFLSWQSSPPAC